MNGLALFRNSTARVSNSKVVPFLLRFASRRAFVASLAASSSRRTIAFAHPACPAAHRMMRPDREAAPRLGLVRVCLYIRELLPLAMDQFHGFFSFAGLGLRPSFRCSGLRPCLILSFSTNNQSKFGIGLFHHRRSFWNSE